MAKPISASLPWRWRTAQDAGGRPQHRSRRCQSLRRARQSWRLDRARSLRPHRPDENYMRPIWAGASIAGSAVTVLAQPGDNWMIHVAVEQCHKGDVVVVVGCT